MTEQEIIDYVVETIMHATTPRPSPEFRMMIEYSSMMTIDLMRKEAERISQARVDFITQGKM